MAERIQILGWPSATAFALDLHRTPQVIHAWLKRGQTPQWPELERLAVVLRCPLAWLILGDGAFEGIGELLKFHEELHGKPLELPGWSRTALDPQPPVSDKGESVLEPQMAFPRFRLARMRPQAIPVLSEIG